MIKKVSRKREYTREEKNNGILKTVKTDRKSKTVG